MGFFERLAVKGAVRRLSKARSKTEKSEQRRKLVAMGARAMPYLEGMLADRSDAVRRAVVGVLRDMRTHNAEKLLIGVLQEDASESVRYKAAEALGRFKGADPIRALVAALRDPSFRVRLCSCAALKAITGEGLSAEEGGISASITSDNLVLDPARLERNVEFWQSWWLREGAARYGGQGSGSSPPEAGLP